MSLRRAMPCQWMEVAARLGSWLDSVAASVSPAETRSSLPGAWPLKAQVPAVSPAPRSTLACAAVRVSSCALPLFVRFLSAAATAGPEGLIRAGVLPEPLQAANAPAPATLRPASRTERRFMLFTGCPLLDVASVRSRAVSAERTRERAQPRARPTAAIEREPKDRVAPGPSFPGRRGGRLLRKGGPEPGCWRGGEEARASRCRHRRRSSAASPCQSMPHDCRPWPWRPATWRARSCLRNGLLRPRGACPRGCSCPRPPWAARECWPHPSRGEREQRAPPSAR